MYVPALHKCHRLARWNRRPAALEPVVVVLAERTRACHNQICRHGEQDVLIKASSANPHFLFQRGVHKNMWPWSGPVFKRGVHAKSLVSKMARTFGTPQGHFCSLSQPLSQAHVLNMCFLPMIAFATRCRLHVDSRANRRDQKLILPRGIFVPSPNPFHKHMFLTCAFYQ